MRKYLKETLEKYQSSMKGFMLKCRNDKKLVAQINEFTSFLDSFDDVSLSERVWYCKNNLKEVQMCPYCRSSRRKYKRMDSELYSTCGNDICKKAGMAAGAESYRDWPTIQEKMKSTYKARTGYDHNSQNPENAAKVKETCKAKYGVDYACEMQKAKERLEEFVKEKYGSQSNVIKENIIKKYGSYEEHAKSCAAKKSATSKMNAFNAIKEKAKSLGFTVLSDDPNIKSYEDLELKCDRCGHIFKRYRDSINHYYLRNLPFCPHCDYKNLTFRSGGERELAEEIQKFYDGEVRLNKHISNYEVDILIPDKKTAIDYNGVYWHSEKFKPKNAHKEKKHAIESAGYKFIQIWEDDWKDPAKKEIILSRLKSKLGMAERIFARKCDVKELVTKEETKLANEFLKKNHLQGAASASRKFALVYDGEIVELAAFGKTRKLVYGNSNGIELIRLCTKNGFNIIGGFSKLMKFAVGQLGSSSIISYADCDWVPYEDNGYLKSGFSMVKETGCNYWWSKSGVRENRMNFTKSKLVSNGADPSKTENEIMAELGYCKVWGSGNLLFRYSSN